MLLGRTGRVGRLLTALWLACVGAGAFAQPVTDDAAAREMHEAFLFAYPYYEFMWLRDQALHNDRSPTHTVLNRFHHQRHLTGPADRWANGPIRDTLYSTAWVDLAAGPVLLTLPDTADRYYVLVLIGADTNSFEYLGRRTTGTRARRVLLVGPGSSGGLPASDQVVHSPTRDVYFNLRVLVRDEADLPAANRVQDGFAITPLAAALPAGPQMRPRDGDVGRTIDIINEALARNPPPRDEASLLERYRKLGICGAGCRFDDLSPQLQARWRALVPKLVAQLKTALDAARSDRPRVNGWLPFRLPRSFGTRYDIRAGSAAMSGGIFGLEAPEATYFMGVADAREEPLGQGRRYRLRLPKDGLPADAFWSVSLYEFVEGGQYMVDNPIGRYTIGDRTNGLMRNADGSLDIWIQPEAPPEPDRRANWLPSPQSNRFYMNARVYQPRPEVLDPRWAMPAIERLDR